MIPSVRSLYEWEGSFAVSTPVAIVLIVCAGIVLCVSCYGSRKSMFIIIIMPLMLLLRPIYSCYELCSVEQPTRVRSASMSTSAPMAQGTEIMNLTVTAISLAASVAVSPPVAIALLVCCCVGFCVWTIFRNPAEHVRTSAAPTERMDVFM
ncbi:hypothetical protein M569_09448 [Genlisea aurea]|uniref:Uncharacterized protein n=1 Tax=Genlisea aurea TaxID=192259 RepID=S8CEK0_9LAMI|nr:hypothetical protein M569_09448 [Genlisea aurea]